MSASVSFGFKAACVSMLVMQNSALALTMRYSRAVLKEQYLTSTTIVLNEVVKLCVAVMMVLVGFRVQRVALRDLPRHLVAIIFCREGMLMLVPGLLYFLMNQLAFVGLENLDASTYSLVSQLKILTTAFFARVLLNKQLAWYQWRALALLVIGVILVQQQPEKPQVVLVQPSLPPPPPPVLGLTPAPTTPLLEIVDLPSSTIGPSGGLTTRNLLSDSEPGEQTYTASTSINLPIYAPQPNIARFNSAGSSAATNSPTTTSAAAASPQHERSVFQQWKGFLAAAVAAVLSGLAGAYMEKMMKGGTLTVWDRNIQLAVYGILLGLAQIACLSSASDRAYAAKNGWLGGYSAVGVVVVLLNSLGGILVSLVLAYLDNIIRGFATSIAIFITAFVSYTVFHDVQITIVFVCGVLTVLLSVFNYNDSMIAMPPAPQLAQQQTAASSPSLPIARLPSTARLLSALGAPTSDDIELGLREGGLVRSRSQASMPQPVDEESASLLRPSPSGSPRA